MIYKLGFLITAATAFYFLLVTIFDLQAGSRPSPASMLVNTQSPASPTSLVFKVGTSKFLASDWPLVAFDLHREFHRPNSPRPATRRSDDNGAITILNLRGIDSMSAARLKSEVENMINSDDVFEEAFLSEILFDVEPAGKQPLITTDISLLLDSWGTRTYSVVSLKTTLPNGPYWRSQATLSHCYKLFPDPHGAFMFGVVSASGDHASSFRRVDSVSIPVPSRLYSGPPTQKQPLRGMRLGVKDIYDIKGLVTSASCRAFAEQYGIVNETAPAVQKLLDLGAVLVGKTKTVEFASGEAPQDWIDYQCPFNPRGDGYFTPSGSSTGSAAGIAAYDWLDYAIGTDTLGSMISPSNEQGLFGIRPTHGLIERKHILKVSDLLDTPGFFSRNIDDFITFGDAWYWKDNNLHSEAMVPKHILYLESWFEPFSKEQRDVLDGFVTNLEELYGVTRTSFDMNAAWQSSHLVEGNQSIQEYHNSTIANIQLYDCWRNTQRFRDDYSSARGHQPYVNPMIRFKWKLGKNLTESQYQEACKRKDIFHQFMQHHVFREKDTILLLPSGASQVRWRDDYRGTPDEAGMKMQGYGFPNIVFGVLGGSPLISVPVGQVKVTSKVTEGVVNQPLSLLVVGPAGTDKQIAAVIREVLSKSGRPLGVKTGADAF